MRLLLINQYYPPDVSATAYLLGELAEDLSRHHEVWVVAGSPSYNPESGTYRPRGPRVVRTWSTAFGRASLPGRIANYGTFAATAISQSRSIPRPDVILAMTDPPIIGRVGLLVARHHQSPFVYVCEDLFPDVGVALRRFDNPLTVVALRRLNRSIRRGADRVVAIGRDMVRKLRRDGVPEGKIALIPNWASDPRIEPSEVESIRRRMRWADSFVVMHAGNVGLAQNLGVLIEAARGLSTHMDVRFVIVGDGAARLELERRVRSLSLKNVDFLPQLPKERVHGLIAAANLHVISLAPDLFGCVVPSKMYGIMAAGRPFVAAVDAHSECDLVIREHECGIRVEPGKPEALADGILNLRGLPLDRMGARGRAAFARLYDRHIATDAYRRLLEEVASEGRKGRERMGGRPPP